MWSGCSVNSIKCQIQMMNRSELLRNAGYWTQDIQLDLYEAVTKYLKDHDMTRADFARKLGVTKGYVSQILNGEFDHKLSKLVELALACDLVPVMNLLPADMAEQACVLRGASRTVWGPARYDGQTKTATSVTSLLAEAVGTPTFIKSYKTIA